MWIPADYALGWEWICMYMYVQYWYTCLKIKYCRVSWCLDYLEWNGKDIFDWFIEMFIYRTLLL